MELAYRQLVDRFMCFVRIRFCGQRFSNARPRFFTRPKLLWSSVCWIWSPVMLFVNLVSKFVDCIYSLFLGTGSGSLTHSLATVVGAEGHVYTHDIEEPQFEKIKNEIKEHHLESCVTPFLSNVCVDGFQVGRKCHAIFLDLPAPWLALPHAMKVFDRSNVCRLVSFSPCIEQSQEVTISITLFIQLICRCVNSSTRITSTTSRQLSSSALRTRLFQLYIHLRILFRTRSLTLFRWRIWNWIGWNANETPATRSRRWTKTALSLMTQCPSRQMPSSKSIRFSFSFHTSSQHTPATLPPPLFSQKFNWYL